MALTDKQKNLLTDLKDLQLALRKDTFEQHKRINPFNEDICDWKERGTFWTNKKNVTLYNSTTVVGDVEIGENTWVGSFVSLDGTAGIKIGEYCSLSSGCQILTHDTVAWALTGGKAEYEYSPTVIGDRCFIGTHAVIMKGVTLGDECVVGAGAVVTKSFPDRSIVAGVPAKLIGTVEIDSKSNKVSFNYGEG